MTTTTIIETQDPTIHTTDTGRSLRLPTADELDTGGTRDDYRVALYLSPAAEVDDEITVVFAHCGAGNIGTPFFALEGRAVQIGRQYGTGVVGEDVLARLVAAAEDILALADSYEGSEWDGYRHQGRWSEDAPDVDLDLDGCARYWSASDWMGPAREDWPDLCASAGVGPLSPDALVAVVATVEARAAHDGQRVSGLDDYVAELRSEWLAEDALEAADADAGGRLVRHPERGEVDWSSWSQRLPTGCDEPLALALAARQAVAALAVLEDDDDDAEY